MSLEIDEWRQYARDAEAEIRALTTERDRLRAEIEDAVADYNRCVDDVHSLRDELAAVRAELADCRKDAERYKRYLTEIVDVSARGQGLVAAINVSPAALNAAKEFIDESGVC